MLLKVMIMTSIKASKREFVDEIESPDSHNFFHEL
jgi:hypothetical protein